MSGSYRLLQTDDLPLPSLAAVLASAPVAIACYDGWGCSQTVDAREVEANDEISRTVEFITAWED